ncbi:MAG: hypothetical protein HUU35_18430, partial [Armatimonadetes bacterium]|nr:hypothetical protein [Armatimonadota bacterium]
AEVRTDAAGGAEFTARLAPATAWTARLGAAGGGLSGESAYLCYTPDKKDWSVSIAPNGYFQHQGQGWLPLGGFYANWVGDVSAEGEAGRKLTSFVETTDAQKTAWFKFLAEQGVTALRFMLRAHRPNGMEPMDIGGKVNPELYAEALHLMDLARPFGIRFLLVLHEDYTKPMYFNHDARSRFCLPRWEGLDLDALPPFQRRFVRDGKLLESIDQKYTDPDAIACQDLYAREIVGLLKHNPQVFAYELENEMVAVPASWVNHANEVIRSVDRATPICMSHGGGGLHTGDPWFWRTRSNVDFYTYHLYPGGTTSPETDYGLLTDVLTRYGRMAGRCFLGECAGDEFWNWGDEAERRRMARDLIWFSLVNGNPGCFFWNNRGYEVAEFRQARAIAEAAGVANWTGRKAPIAVLVGHPLDDDRWFRSPAGEAASRLMSRYARHYLQQGADFDFAWSADGYQATSDLSNFAPVAAPRRPIAPSEGFEALTLTRADGGAGLTYLRNAAGVKKVVTPGQSPRTMYLREIAPRSLKLALGLDPGRYQLSVTDLVSGERRECEADASGTIELGESNHDFAILWTRR